MISLEIYSEKVDTQFVNCPLDHIYEYWKFISCQILSITTKLDRYCIERDQWSGNRENLFRT